MIKGFPEAWGTLVETRIESLIVDDDFNRHTTTISKDIQNLISPNLDKKLDDRSKHEMVEDLSQLIFDALYSHSKLVYDLAFNDSYQLLIEHKNNKHTD